MVLLHQADCQPDGSRLQIAWPQVRSHTSPKRTGGRGEGPEAKGHGPGLRPGGVWKRQHVSRLWVWTPNNTPPCLCQDRGFSLWHFCWMGAQTTGAGEQTHSHIKREGRRWPGWSAAAVGWRGRHCDKGRQTDRMAIHSSLQLWLLCGDSLGLTFMRYLAQHPWPSQCPPTGLHDWQVRRQSFC